jgi:hypothetical protein
MAGSVHHDNGPHPVCLCTGQRFGQSAPLRIWPLSFSGSPSAIARVRRSSSAPRSWHSCWRRLSSGRRICGSLRKRSCCAASWQLSATCSRPTRGMRPFSGQLTRRCRSSSWTTSSHAPSVGSIPDWSQPPSSGISLARPRNAHPRASPYALAIMAVPGARASGHGGQHAPADTEGQRARRTGSGWPHAGCEGLARTVRSSVRC